MISIKAARRAGVPLVVIETADPQQTITTIIKELNGKLDETPLMRWDINRSLVGLNEVGGEVVGVVTNGEPASAQNPAECLTLLAKTPEEKRAIVFFLGAHNYWSGENGASVRQAIWNLRDVYKGIGATLVLLCISATTLPDELKPDCIVLEDTLPNEDEINSIIESVLKDAKLDPKKVPEKEKIADTMLGLSAFCAEQVLAMSVLKDGIDRAGLWERKRKMIEQTDGLSVWRGGDTYADIGGYDYVKDFMRDICNGRKPPRAIVFIDEIEKSLAGNQSDSSGVSQDQLRCLLTEMQDKDAVGVIYVGPAGSAKSAVAKATGNEVNIPTIALDMGAMKGSLVGESEQKLRTALKVIQAVSQGNVLYIATCNSMAVLPPELRRRFSLGTFFFPLPDEPARKKIWGIYLKKFELKDKTFPKDEGWTGAEIRNCANIAWRLKRSLTESAKSIVPVSVSGKEQLERLCNEAHNRYIDASIGGMYKYGKFNAAALSSGGRVITSEN